jgi:hypothetical protein
MRMSRTPLYRLQGLPAFGTALPIGAACRNWIVRLRLPGLDAQSVTFWITSGLPVIRGTSSLHPERMSHLNRTNAAL